MLQSSKNESFISFLCDLLTKYGDIILAAGVILCHLKTIYYPVPYEIPLLSNDWTKIIEKFSIPIISSKKFPDPIGWHVISTTLHILSAILLYRVLSTITNHKLLSLSAVLIWSVSPLVTNTILVPSSRVLVLSFILVLTAILVQLKNSSFFTILISFALFLIAFAIHPAGLLFIPLSIFTRYSQIKIKMEHIAAIFISAVILSFTHLHSKNFAVEKIWNSTAAVVKSFLTISPYNSISCLTSTTAGIMFLAILFIAGFLFRYPKREAFFPVALLPVIIMHSKAEPWPLTSSYILTIGISAALVFLYSRLLSKLRQKDIIALISAISAVSISIYKTNVSSARIWQNDLSMYLTYTKIDNRNPYSLTGLGWCYLKRNDNEKAALTFRAAGTLADLKSAEHGLAIALIRKGRPQKAIFSLNKSLKKFPSDPILLNDMALALHILKKDDQAVKMLEKVIKKNPYYKKAWFNLYNLYRKKGDKKKEIEILKRASEYTFDPLFILPLATHLILKENYLEAEKILKGALAHRSKNENIYVMLAQIYMSQGRYKNALKTALKGLKTNPNSVELRKIIYKVSSINQSLRLR